MTTISRRATINPADVAADGRTLDVTMLPWNTVARVSDGGAHYEEIWQPGSLVADGATVPVYAGHTPTARGIEHGPLIGRVATAAADATGFAGALELADTATARDVYELARLVGADVSIEADTGPIDTPPDRTGRVVRTAKNPATLTGVAVILAPNRGAIPGATVTAARALPKEADMSDTPTPQPVEPTPDPDDPVTPDEVTIGRADIAEIVRAEVSRVRLPQLREAGHPLAVYRSFVEYADAAYSDRQLARALADQITTDNAKGVGVNRPAWLNDVYGIIDFGRPVITAIGTAGLPDGGMAIDWPYYDGDLLTLVAAEATEKTQITSVKVTLKSGSSTIKTFAGGSDLSYQLIRRSSPSYRDAYLRIMSAAYAAVTDKAAADALVALISLANGNYVIYDIAAADPTGALLRGAVFAASVKVETATGRPASVVLAGSTAFVALGGKLTPAPVFNASGSAEASTLDVNVSGLRLVHAPHLPASAVLVTNNGAVTWMEDGPMTISAPDIALLGENVAVWGMASMVATTPKGVVSLQATAPATQEAQEAETAKGK